MYENVKYTKNFLKEVIIRIDFLSPLEKNKSKITSKLNKKILSSFGVPETKEVITNEMAIKLINNKAIPEIKSEKIKEFHYYGINREKEFVISKDYLYISYKKYDFYETLKTDFTEIINELFNIEDEVQVKRIGLRYINSIELDEDEPTNWKSYINDDLIAPFNFYQDSKKISRVFNILELNYDNYKLRYQYGMHNPDYPSPIVKKLFILDFDAYYEGLVEKVREIESYIELFHNEIQGLYESSIKEGLRSKMT